MLASAYRLSVPPASNGHQEPVVATVIIPAHDEAAVIGRCLLRLRSCNRDSQHIVTVANGCEDDTAAIARSFGATVIEIDEASKIAALRAGERLAEAKRPRIFVDADVEVDAGATQALAAALERGDALVGGLRADIDAGQAAWAVKLYYRIWEELPWLRDGVIGSGVYGLSAEGRQRFGEFPDVIADDLFVVTRFSPSERLVLPDHTFLVRTPRTMAALLAVRTRVHAGNMQIRRDYPSPYQQSVGRGLLRLAARPELWPSLAVYLFITSAAKFRARRMLRSPGQTPWLRDETARV